MTSSVTLYNLNTLATMLRTNGLQPVPLKSGTNASTFDFSGASGSVSARVGYLVGATAYSDIQLVFDNWTLSNTTGAGEQVGDNDITVKAAIEYGGATYPVYFGASRTTTLTPGSSVTSARCAIELPAGATFYTRTWYSYTAGTCPVLATAPDAAVSGSGYGPGDLVDATGTVNTSSNNTGLVGPTMILGRPTSRIPVVGILGDSVAMGVGDTIKNGGFIRRALGTSKSNISLGRASERASTAAPLNQHARRFLHLHYATHVIEQYGINDIGNAQATATIQASKVALWQAIKQRGIRCYATTITPSTSNDATKEGRRTTINDWIRDGAPLNSSGVAVATGTNTAGTVRIGAATHPLVGYFEVADLAETTRNSGTWRVGYSDDGTHPNATGAAALAAAINPGTFVL